jgi:DNA topoisomerase-3
VSSRTRRKFSAFLVRGADGKVGFEFEKKAPRAPAKKKTDAAETAAEAKPATRAKRKTA